MKSSVNSVIAALGLLFLGAGVTGAQTPAPKSVLGTVTLIKPQSSELQVKPDNAAPIPVRLLDNTVVQRIAPGETNLKNAATINISELAAGDRVLVTLAPNATDVLRILVMSATDIARRDETDRLDWSRRGISGIVSAKTKDQITLKAQGPQGESLQTVTVSEATMFKRYPADSVKFAEVKPGRIDDVSIGDQLRARGDRSADGSKVAAEEVVFGTFLTRAGSVVSVDANARQITVKELGANKSFVIKLTPDSQIKQAPDLLAADGRGGRGIPPGAGPNAATGARGAPNVSQMIETLPAGKLEDIKPGMSVVVSSTRGAQEDQITAILLVTNADLLIRLASAPRGGGNGVLTFGSGAGGAGLGVLGITP